MLAGSSPSSWEGWGVSSNLGPNFQDRNQRAKQDLERRVRSGTGVA